MQRCCARPGEAFKAVDVRSRPRFSCRCSAARTGRPIFGGRRLALSGLIGTLLYPQLAAADEAEMDEPTTEEQPPAEEQPRRRKKKVVKKKKEDISTKMPPKDGEEPETNLTVLSKSDVARLNSTQRQIYEFNTRIQRQNNAPEDFPHFVREGFDMIMLLDGYEVDSDGLIYKDYKVGDGVQPVDGQQVTFDYVAYNEAGGLIDSTYRKGQVASSRLGQGGMIPGFELGVKGMKAGGLRRIIVPPKLGPPVGPQTFFSAKQFEVFDVELRTVKDCRRETSGMLSKLICE
ncbi:unnamed protein product [Pedinophyceae sp. YPF-701]|nr:unnamed protein product [Pedinophyceae sp. YPF-701]